MFEKKVSIFCYNISLAVVALGMPIIVLTCNVYQDPFQIFRQKDTYLPAKWTIQNYQNAGLINSQTFDAFFIGTSVSADLSVRHIEKKLGKKYGFTKVMPLIRFGLQPYENLLILKRALHKHSETKLVINELFGIPEGGVALVGHPNIHQETKSNNLYIDENSSFLYDNNPLNDLTLFKDFRLFKFWNNQRVDDYRRIFYLYHEHGFYFPSFHIPLIISAKQTHQPSQIIDYTKRYKELDIFADEIIGIARRYKNTRFVYYIPPVNIYTLQNSLSFLLYIINRIQAEPNIDAYCFIGLKFTHDLRLYRDLFHIHPYLNCYMIDLIAEDAYKINSETDIQKQIQEYKHNYDATPVRWNPDTAIDWYETKQPLFQKHGFRIFYTKEDHNLTIIQPAGNAEEAGASNYTVIAYGEGKSVAQLAGTSFFPNKVRIKTQNVFQIGLPLKGWSNIFTATAFEVQYMFAGVLYTTGKLPLPKVEWDVPHELQKYTSTFKEFAGL